MILGIGTDIVAIKRFESWQQFPRERLQRIFTQPELDYCANPQGGYVLERLAARFAAKEAFYKALSSALLKIDSSLKAPPFLTIAPLIRIHNGLNGVPELIVDWKVLGESLKRELPPMTVCLSLSHEKDYALAFVLLDRTCISF